MIVDDEQWVGEHKQRAHHVVGVGQQPEHVDGALLLEPDDDDQHQRRRAHRVEGAHVKHEFEGANGSQVLRQLIFDVQGLLGFLRIGAQVDAFDQEQTLKILSVPPQNIIQNMYAYQI